MFLKIGDHSVHARFEEGRSKEDKISAVQYVKFPLSRREISEFVGGADAELMIEHPNYRVLARIGQEIRKSLIEDLTG